MSWPQAKVGLSLVFLLMGLAASVAGENWLQLKYDSRRSGNVPQRTVRTPLGLIGAVPLTDAVYTAPVVADEHVYVVDGAGVAFCINTKTLRTVWKFETRGGEANCNNVSSPAIAGRYLHFGTMAGSYYVLDAATGTVVKEIPCGAPIFSAPVVANQRVYFSTLGARVFALESDGAVIWQWDYVTEELGFTGDRWSGADWRKHKEGRVFWSDQFCGSRDLAVDEKTLVVPVSGSAVWLEDLGDRARLRDVFQGPREKINVVGVSMGESGAAYVQWMRNDNNAQLQINRRVNGKMESEVVPGTITGPRGPTLVSFNSASLRGNDVYRCRPEEDFGLCKHAPGQEEPQYLGGYPSIAPPILLRDTAVYGGLDGSLYVVPLAGDAQPWSLKTSFGKAISAPVAVCDGRIYFGCEDGYLYILGPGGRAPLPTEDLQLWKIRSPLTSKLADSKYDWFTNFGNWANTNANDQAVKPPFQLKWIRRFEGTTKQFSTCGGGRMYTHTAEGQIFAVEQETGRQLWRVYYPGVYVSYTSPLYYKGRLLVPQAGLKKSSLRCLDASTGELLWEAPFAGSPSWNRQLPPMVYKNLAIYMFGTGKYSAGGWLFGHQNNRSFPEDHRPLVRAWNIETGKEVWTKDFSEFGSGGDDAGLCLIGDTLYYSCYFGHSPSRRGRPGAQGITAAMDPLTRKVHWQTTECFVHGGCTISGQDGRLYLGGYGKLKEGNSFVWCIDADDGSLVWQSDPVKEATHVVTLGPRFLFVHSQYKNGLLLDKETGKILTTLTKNYRCTRFVFSEPYLIGPNMDMIDLSDTHEIKLVSSGPPVDVYECVGAIVSNGRVFYTAHAGCLQFCQVYGEEAAALAPPWKISP